MCKGKGYSVCNTVWLTLERTYTVQLTIPSSLNNSVHWRDNDNQNCILCTCLILQESTDTGSSTQSTGSVFRWYYFQKNNNTLHFTVYTILAYPLTASQLDKPLLGMCTVIVCCMLLYVTWWTDILTYMPNHRSIGIKLVIEAQKNLVNKQCTIRFCVHKDIELQSAPIKWPPYFPVLC